MLQCSILSFFLFFPLSSLACPIYRARAADPNSTARPGGLDYVVYYCCARLIRAVQRACGGKRSDRQKISLFGSLYSLSALAYGLYVDCNRREN